MNRWTWLLQYGVACFLALLLAGILGGTQLFQHTTLGASGPAASDIVRFLGDGAALLLLWLAAARAATALPDDRSWRSMLRHTLTPLATLVVVVVGYGVPLFVLRPVLNQTAMATYGWLFVLATMTAAVWLAVSAYQHAGGLDSTISRIARRRAIPLPATTTATPPATKTAEPDRCRECGATLAADATSCPRCGHRRAA
jgi:hypothetical protein